MPIHPRALAPVALSAIVVAFVAACGGPTSAPTQPTPGWSSQATDPSPTFAEPSPALRTAKTGVFAYDFGYNEAVATYMRTPSECEFLARSVWDQTPNAPERELEFLTVYQGCLDGIFNRVPHFTSPSDLPAGGVPYVDPCQDGDIGPWVVIYDGPAGPGDVSVGAPCQEIAEEYALGQLPPGSFVVDAFRV